MWYFWECFLSNSWSYSVQHDFLRPKFCPNVFFNFVHVHGSLCVNFINSNKKRFNLVFEGTWNSCYVLWFISGFSFLSNFTLYQVSFLPNSSETYSIKKKIFGRWKVDGPCCSLRLVEFRSWMQVLHFGSTVENQNTNNTQFVLHGRVSSVSHTWTHQQHVLWQQCFTEEFCICSRSCTKHVALALEFVRWFPWTTMQSIHADVIQSMRLLRTHTCIGRFHLSVIQSCCTFNFIPGLTSFYSIKPYVLQRISIIPLEH